MRKPLADLTNTSAISASASAAVTPCLPEHTPASRKRSRSSARIAASGSENNGGDATPVINTRSIEPAADLDGEAIFHVRTDSVVYTIRSKAGRIKDKETAESRKDKEKAVADVIASSCPPIGRTRIIEYAKRREPTMEDGEADIPNQISNTGKIVKKRRHTVSGLKPWGLPRDFVEKQRAYFAEIDSFDLPVVSVSSSESASESEVES